MEHYPHMYIKFPSAREDELHDEMKRLATNPWSPQIFNPIGRPSDEEHFYFHRAVVGNHPACTVCVWRKGEGQWVVQNIVPDKDQPSHISIVQHKEILNQFESAIAEPAARRVGGVTSIEISVCRLRDHFSQQAVTLLERFCQSSNQSDFGTHISDQEKWLDFLLQVYRDNAGVHCDIFGKCLQNQKWWPEKGIPKLVSEYDFAMRLLKQSEK